MNLLPLIDVLVVLIFFAFVTMQFRSAAIMQITLPEMRTAGKSEVPERVTISIDQQGNFLFQGQPGSESELGSFLDSVRELSRDIPIVVRADKETPLRLVTLVWDEARARGLNRTTLETR
jgi:biopolymer transport protein ExbD